LLEYAAVRLIFDNNKTKNEKLIKLENLGTMNINFSVALYDSIFSLIHNFTDEKEKYNKIKLGENNSETLPKRNGSGNMNFNPSSYYIKN
jgi:hypothetical protein